jgi:ABC-2 type transport system ATP-binding protein
LRFALQAFTSENFVGNLLTVSNLDKKFGHREVLQQVSFEIREEEVLGLIGPNGAGKTTLLECLADLVPTNGGSLAYRDKPLGSLDRKQVLFYVPDGIVPWAEQTVKWVLRFFEKLYNQP